MNKLIALCVLLLAATGCASQSIDYESKAQNGSFGYLLCSYEDFDIYVEGVLVSPQPSNSELIRQVLHDAGVADYEEEATSIGHIFVRAADYEKALTALARAEVLHGRKIQLNVSFLSLPEEVQAQDNTITVQTVGRSERPFPAAWIDHEPDVLPSP